MYVPHLFREDDPATLLAFMTAHSFITLVTIVDGAPFASHVPVVVKTHGDTVQITGHLAKPNPQSQSLDGHEALAIFSGPHAYISPAHYEKFESVPTWNYIAVHAYGTAQLVPAQERDRLRAMMDDLIVTYDAAYQAQWDALPEQYREGMLQGVVGFEITVTRLEGKTKLSQNRSLTDRVNVAAALVASQDSAIRATGAAMRAALQRDGVA